MRIDRSLFACGGSEDGACLGPAVAHQDKSYLSAIFLTVMTADDGSTANLIMDPTFRREIRSTDAGLRGH